MNFLNSFLGSSVSSCMMDSIADTRRQLLGAMPKCGRSNPPRNAPDQRAAIAAADAAFLNSHLDGVSATSGASMSRNNISSTNHANNNNTSSRSFFYNEDRLLDPDFIDHLAEYSDTEGGTDDVWGNFGLDDDDDRGGGTHLESGFTPENVFGPTEADASSKATSIDPKNSSAAVTMHQYQGRCAEAQAYADPTDRHSKPAPRSAPQKRKSFTLTEEEPTMYIPDDMINIEAYMGPPSDICPPPPDQQIGRYSESESFDDSESEEEDAKRSTSGSHNRRDHADPFSNLAESSARTESTRRYLEESRKMSTSIPDFHTVATSNRMSSSSSSLLNSSFGSYMNSSFNSSGFSSASFHHASHNSTSSFHTGFNSSSASSTIPENNPTSSEHQTRMSNLLSAMERTEQSRTLLRRRSAASASSVSASGITSLAMGRIGGPRKSRGSSPPRSFQRLF